MVVSGGRSSGLGKVGSKLLLVLKVLDSGGFVGLEVGLVLVVLGLAVLGPVVLDMVLANIIFVGSGEDFTEIGNAD